MSKKTILFKTSDGENFEVEEAVVEQFQAIKDMFDDVSAVTSIPLTNISGEIFAKVLQYCRRHAEVDSDEADLESFDADFDLQSFDEDFVKVDHQILFDLILAANYLNVKGLHDLTCESVGKMMMGKTVEEIRKHFKITDSSSSEQNIDLSSFAFV